MHNVKNELSAPRASTPGHGRTAEHLAYYLVFEPGAKGWDESYRRRVPISATALPNELGLVFSKKAGHAVPFDGSQTRAFIRNPFGKKGDPKATPKLICAIDKLVSGVFPHPHRADAQSAMDDMNRVATEDQASPAEALRRFEGHYRVLMKGLALGLPLFSDGQERLGAMLLQQHFYVWLAGLHSKSNDREALIEVSREAIRLSRNVRLWMTDPANGIAPSPVVQAALFKLLANELVIAVRDPSGDPAAVRRKAESEDFFELARQHQTIVGWYFPTPWSALLVSSALEDYGLTLEFGSALLRADPDFKSETHKPFVGWDSIEEEPLLKYYRHTVRPKLSSAA